MNRVNYFGIHTRRADFVGYETPIFNFISVMFEEFLINLIIDKD